MAMSTIRILLAAGIAFGLTGPVIAANGPPPSAPPAPYDDSVTSSNEFRGHWEGTWHGDDGRIYSGDYQGSFHGTVNGADVNAAVPPPFHRGPPPWREGDGREGSWHDGHPRGYWPYTDGPGSTVYYAQPGVTTIIIQPSVTTTTYIDEEITEVPSRTVRRTSRVHRGCRCK
jgi:hypothetical protein